METTKSLAVTSCKIPQGMNINEYDDWEIQFYANLDAPSWTPRGSTYEAGEHGFQIVTVPIMARLI